MRERPFRAPRCEPPSPRQSRHRARSTSGAEEPQYLMRSASAGASLRSILGSRPMRVVHDRPLLRPTTTEGTISTEPASSGSNVKAPKATAPLPGTPTSFVDIQGRDTARGSELAALSRNDPSPGSTDDSSRLAPRDQALDPCRTHAIPLGSSELPPSRLGRRHLKLRSVRPEPFGPHRFVPVNSCTAPRPKRRTLTSLKPASSSRHNQLVLGWQVCTRLREVAVRVLVRQQAPNHWTRSCESRPCARNERTGLSGWAVSRNEARPPARSTRPLSSNRALQIDDVP